MKEELKVELVIRTKLKTAFVLAAMCVNKERNPFIFNQEGNKQPIRKDIALELSKSVVEQIMVQLH
jgi:hypothetical protein